ncbi:MAG TPA: acyltransferase [Caulobacteraceae bacterium]|nr:acyltransferase [Caulobacteraceae bacterium]
MATRDNSIGFIRLLLASAVILSHSPELIDGSPAREIGYRLTGLATTGEMAVHGFFLLSGFLIAKSYVERPSVPTFLWSRILRIYPGFIVASLFCLLVVAPLAGGAMDLDLLDALRWVWLEPPIAADVFAGLPYPRLNGPMWTIAYEMRCYLLVLVLGVCGLLQRRAVIAVAGVCLLVAAPHVDAPLGGRLLLLFGEPTNTVRLTGFFLVGASFYLYREKVRYSSAGVLIAFVLLALFVRVEGLSPLAQALAGGYLLFASAFAAAPAYITAIGRRTDISYGVYLYAYPIQNLIIYYFPGVSPWTLFPISLALASAFGALSWFAVERPSLRLKKVLTRGASRAAPASTAW